MADRSYRKRHSALLPKTGRRLLELEMLEDRRVLSGGSLLLAVPLAAEPVLQASVQTTAETAPVQIDYSVTAAVETSVVIPVPSVEAQVAADVGQTGVAVNASATLTPPADGPAILELPALQATVQVTVEVGPVRAELSVSATVGTNSSPNAPSSLLPFSLPTLDATLSAEVSLAPAKIDTPATSETPLLQVAVKVGVETAPVQTGVGVTVGTTDLPPTPAPIGGILPGTNRDSSTTPVPPGQASGTESGLLLPQSFGSTEGNNGAQATGSGEAQPARTSSQPNPPAAATPRVSPRLDGGGDSTDEEASDEFDYLYDDDAAPAPSAAAADRVFAADPAADSSEDSLPANGDEMDSELLIAFALAGGVGSEMLFKELLARLKRSGRIRDDLAASRELALWLMGGSVALAGTLHSCRKRKGSKENRRPSANPSSWKWLAGSTTLAPRAGS